MTLNKMIRRYFRVALSGVFVLVIFANVYFLNVVVQSSSDTEYSEGDKLRSKNLLDSTTNNNKFDGTKISKIKFMESQIEAKLRSLPAKYYKQNSSYISILKNLVTELQTDDVKRDDLWTLPNDVWPNAQYLLPNPAPELGTILRAMRTLKIIKSDNAGKGTQLKLLLTLENDVKVLFKPQWYKRDTIIEGPVYKGKDRHNAEIVAFHLSSLLGFRRVPIAAIRTINLKDEISRTATPELLKTIFKHKSNTCVYGVCHYCSKNDSVCGNGDMLEGALILWLPPSLKLVKYRHPWQRMYNNKKLALWETDTGYCEKVKKSKIYSPKTSNRLLDLIDAAIFDFLMDNGDRHHYELYEKQFNNSAVLLIDNGKSLGNPFADHYDILTPLYQCCMIYKSTWNRLTMFSGGALSLALNKLVKFESDSAKVLPLLTPEHLRALDRRLLTVFAVVEMCIKEKKYVSDVILDQ